MKYIILTFLLCYALPAFSQSWQFTKKIGGIQNKNSTGLAADKDGNSYIIGNFKGSITLDTISISGGSTRNVFVAKYNSFGNIIWAVKAASAIDSILDGITINAISVDGAGHIYITGNYIGNATFFGTKHTSIGSSEIYLAKLTQSGDLIWLRTAGGYGVGNYNQNEPYALCIDGSGNCYVTGRYFKTAIFDTITISATLPNEFFIAKYNSDGNIVWAKSGGGDFGIHNGFGIACDTEGNTFVTGDFFGHLLIDGNVIDAGDPEQKMFIAKYSPSGKTLWAKEIGSGGYYGIAAALCLDKNGNSYITGFFRSTINFGLTALTFNRSVIAYAMLEVKYDPDGNFIWAVKSDGAEQNTRGLAICGDPQGNTYITGGFSKKTSFGSTTLTKDSGSSTFVTKLDSQGNFLWAKQTGGNGSNSGNGIALQTTGEILVGGGFTDTVTFDSKILVSSGGSDVFIAALTDPRQSVRDYQHEVNSPDFYPNPVDRTLRFLKKHNITMFDVLGRDILRCNDCDELHTAQLPEGAYYIKGHLIIIKH